MDFYDVLKLDDLINPGDLVFPMSDLVDKVIALETFGAPPMLISVMYSLVQEIHINRKEALAIINIENPDPLMIPMVVFSTNSKLQKEKLAERIKILKVLKKAGWRVRLTASDNFIKLSVAKYALMPT